MPFWVRVSCLYVMCVLGTASLATAAPGNPLKEKLDTATALLANAEDDAGRQRVLALAEEVLAVEPGNQKALELQGDALSALREPGRALEIYERVLASGVSGSRRRVLKDKIAMAREATGTFLEVVVTGDPAAAPAARISLRDRGLFCEAAPSCKQPLSPRTYRVEAERPGYKPWTGPIKVEAGQVTRLEIKLEELPSQLTVLPQPATAKVTVDGQPLTGPMELAAGTHQVEVSADGHEPQRVEAVARAGAPVALTVKLWPRVQVRVSPANAELLVNGKVVAVQEGRVALPPEATEVVGRAAGYKERRIALPAERGPDTQVDVKLEALAVASTAPSRPSQFTNRRKLALGIAGVGVAALGAGVLLGMKSGQLEDDAYKLCPVPTDCGPASEANSLIDRGQTKATQANLAYGVAAGALVGATVLWLLGSPSEAPVAVSPRVGAITGLDVVARF